MLRCSLSHWTRCRCLLSPHARQIPSVDPFQRLGHVFDKVRHPGLAPSSALTSPPAVELNVDIVSHCGDDADAYPAQLRVDEFVRDRPFDALVCQFVWWASLMLERLDGQSSTILEIVGPGYEDGVRLDTLFGPCKNGLVEFARDEDFLKSLERSSTFAISQIHRHSKQAKKRVGHVSCPGRLPPGRPAHLLSNARILDVTVEIVFVNGCC